MIDIQLLRKDIDTVAARLATRKFQLDVAGFNAIEAERKAIQTRTEDLQGKRTGMDAIFHMHHLAHAQNNLLEGKSVGGGGAKAIKESLR